MLALISRNCGRRFPRYFSGLITPRRATFKKCNEKYAPTLSGKEETSSFATHPKTYVENLERKVKKLEDENKYLEQQIDYLEKRFLRKEPYDDFLL